MKIKLKTTYAGPRGCFAAGSIADLPNDEAAGLVHGGYATYCVAELPSVAEPSPFVKVKTHVGLGGVSEAIPVAVPAPEPSVKRGRGRPKKGGLDR